MMASPFASQTIIVQYIEDVWGASGACIMPSDPCERAVACFWAVYIDDKWFPLLIGASPKQRQRRPRQKQQNKPLLGCSYWRNFSRKVEKRSVSSEVTPLDTLTSPLGVSWVGLKLSKLSQA